MSALKEIAWGIVGVFGILLMFVGTVRLGTSIAMDVVIARLQKEGVCVQMPPKLKSHPYPDGVTEDDRRTASPEF